MAAARIDSVTLNTRNTGWRQGAKAQVTGGPAAANEAYTFVPVVARSEIDNLENHQQEKGNTLQGY